MPELLVIKHTIPPRRAAPEVGIVLSCSILAVIDIRVTVGGPNDARRTARLGVQISVVVAGRYGNPFVTTGIRIGKAYDAGHVDGIGVACGVGRIGNVNLSPVVHAVNGNVLSIGIASANQGHMHQTGGPAAIGHGRIAGDIPYFRTIHHAGNHTCAEGNITGHREGAIVLYYKILNDCAGSQVAEQTIMLAGNGLVTYQMKVLDVVGITVKLARERIAFADGWYGGIPGCRYVSNWHIVVYSVKVYIVQEIHPALGIFPFGSGFAGVHGCGKGFEISRSGNALRLFAVYVQADG